MPRVVPRDRPGRRDAQRPPREVLRELSAGPEPHAQRAQHRRAPFESGGRRQTVDAVLVRIERSHRHDQAIALGRAASPEPGRLRLRHACEARPVRARPRAGRLRVERAAPPRAVALFVIVSRRITVSARRDDRRIGLEIEGEMLHRLAHRRRRRRARRCTSGRPRRPRASPCARIPRAAAGRRAAPRSCSRGPAERRRGRRCRSRRGRADRRNAREAMQRFDPVPRHCATMVDVRCAQHEGSLGAAKIHEAALKARNEVVASLEARANVVATARLVVFGGAIALLAAIVFAHLPSGAWLGRRRPRARVRRARRRSRAHPRREGAKRGGGALPRACARAHGRQVARVRLDRRDAGRSTRTPTPATSTCSARRRSSSSSTRRRRASARRSSRAGSRGRAQRARMRSGRGRGRGRRGFRRVDPRTSGGGQGSRAARHAFAKSSRWSGACSTRASPTRGPFVMWAGQSSVAPSKRLPGSLRIVARAHAGPHDRHGSGRVVGPRAARRRSSCRS